VKIRDKGVMVGTVGRPLPHPRQDQGAVEENLVDRDFKHIDKVKAWPDAHLYHVIAAGQGVMGPYASHIPQAYRWQVVNYIRFLEKQAAK
jgi:hypothetical protein